MMARGFLITGRPGVGKTTVLVRVIEAVKSRGFRVGGMICREVRVGGSRIGFKVEDLDGGGWGWLARVDFKTSVRVGRYGVNLKDLNDIGVKALENALENPEIHLIALDEIGPMELKSRRFREAVMKLVHGSKPVIAVVHHRARDPLIELVKSQGFKVIEVTRINRDRLPGRIASEVLKMLV